MIKKLLLVILLMPLVLGYADIINTDNVYSSSKDIYVFNITQCEGPIRVKVTNDDGGYDNSRLSIVGCVLDNTTQFWTCECDKNAGTYNVVMNAKTGSYNAVVEYYLKWTDYVPSETREPSYSEIKNNDWKFQRSAMGIKVANIFTLPVFYLSNFGTYAILCIMLFIALIVGILIYKLKDYAKPLFNKDDDDIKDVLNYKLFKDADTQDVEDEKDKLLNDILNDIK